MSTQAGCPTASGPYEFAEAYRGALRGGAPFPPRKFPGEWGQVLTDALRLTATERIANGSELELRCRAAEPETPTSGTVPVSLRGPETAVASPKAMADQTVEAVSAVGGGVECNAVGGGRRAQRRTGNDRGRARGVRAARGVPAA